jgi:hypothetical protein
LLHRACAHCGRFLAAATRRCLGRVAVPVWLIVLTDQLPVIGLVGYHPTNNLMGRTPLSPRPKAFLTCVSVRGISTPFGALFPTDRQVRTCSSAVRHSKPEGSAFDLHALGTPPALILSQDQTRQKMVKLDVLTAKHHRCGFQVRERTGNARCTRQLVRCSGDKKARGRNPLDDHAHHLERKRRSTNDVVADIS